MNIQNNVINIKLFSLFLVSVFINAIKSKKFLLFIWLWGQHDGLEFFDAEFWKDGRLTLYQRQTNVIKVEISIHVFSFCICLKELRKTMMNTMSFIIFIFTFSNEWYSPSFPSPPTYGYLWILRWFLIPNLFFPSHFHQTRCRFTSMNKNWKLYIKINKSHHMCMHPMNICHEVIIQRNSESFLFSDGLQRGGWNYEQVLSWRALRVFQIRMFIL